MKDENNNQKQKQSHYRKDRVQAKQKFFGSTTVAYSKNHERVCILESSLERDYFIMMQFEALDDYHAQPTPMKHLVDGKVQNYTPDVCYIKDGEQYIVEIKPHKYTLSDDFKSKVTFLTDEYKKRGIHFSVVTEKDIYDGYRIQNLSMLRPSLSHPAPVNEVKQLKQSLNNNRKYTLSEMNAKAINIGISPAYIKRAIAHGLFKVDMTVHYSRWQVSI